MDLPEVVLHNGRYYTSLVMSVIITLAFLLDIIHFCTVIFVPFFSAPVVSSPVFRVGVTQIMVSWVFMRSSIENQIL